MNKKPKKIMLLLLNNSSRYWHKMQPTERISPQRSELSRTEGNLATAGELYDNMMKGF